ncbi:MAG: hypothetical protein Q4B28_07720 [bacterium]|nr:hypothetical protein [bacterium]
MSAFSITGLDLSNLQPRSKGKLSSLASKYAAKVMGKVDLGAFKQKTKKYLKGNTQYYIISGILGLMVLFLGYAVLSQFRETHQ